jgi:hypothetical protein
MLLALAAVVEPMFKTGGEVPAQMTGPRSERLAKQLMERDNVGGYYLLGRVWEAGGLGERAAGAQGTFLEHARADHVWRADAEARLKKLRGGG